tara:strand:+ start:23313 stop:25010 length:1698 start_codon:yes stop_codon:yes gene_type:complete
MHIMLGVMPMLVFMHAPSWGQSVSIPSSANSARTQQYLDSRNRAVTQGDITPPKDIELDSRVPRADQGPMLKNIILRGATLYSREDLDFILQDYLNQPIDMSTLNHLANRITAYYRQQGYFLSRALIPPQTISNNTLTLQIIEGYIHNIIIDDPDNLLSSSQMTAAHRIINKISHLKPLHGPTLERYMLLLNEGAGISMQSVMQPAKDATQVGGITLLLKPQKKAAQLNLNANNHGSRYIGPWQFQTSYQTGNVFTPLDTLSAQGAIARPLKEIQYGSLNYSRPVGSEGMRWQNLVSYSNSNPGSTLRSLEAETDTFVYKTGFSYPVTRSRKESLDVAAHFTFRNTATEILDSELIDDKTRSLSISGDYQAYDHHQGINRFSVGLHKGFDILGVRTTGSDNLSRAQGRSDFVKVTASAQRVQFLPHDLTLDTQAEGQFAPHPLLSSEEFGYGGSDMGLAYDPSEITGDKGIKASASLTYYGVPPLGDIVSCSPFIFYDIGKVWNDDRSTKPISAASAGLGANYQFNHVPASGRISLAYPLTKSIDHPDMNGENGPRILFELNLTF